MLVRPAALVFVAASLSILGGLGCESAPEPGRRDPAAPPPDRARAAPDSSTMHDRVDADVKTPFDQAENGPDIDITASIRRQLMERSDLSMAAKNAKVMTADGVVSLRGMVSSAAEKAQLGAIATGTAGVKRVDNQLEVSPPQ